MKRGRIWMAGTATVVLAAVCALGAGTASQAAKKTTVKLSKGKIVAKKKSFSVNKKKKTVTIKKSGTYTLSGNIGAYRVIVSKGRLKVTLKLKGVTAKQTSYPCIYSAKSTTSLTVSLVKKTVTKLKGPNNFKLAAGKKEPDAVIFSGGNLTLNGSGNLFVTDVSGNGKGIESNRTVYMKSGYCSVSSKRISLRGQSLVFSQGIFVGNAQDTCVKADQKVAISGGLVTANGVDKGIQGKGGVTISGGTVNVTASYKKGTKFEDFRGITAGVAGNNGKKAVAGSIYVSGGVVKVRSYGDCLHSARDITISGGQFQLTSTGDDGIQAKAALTINGKPTFQITAKGKKVKGTVKKIASNIKYK